MEDLESKRGKYKKYKRLREEAYKFYWEHFQDEDFKMK